MTKTQVVKVVRETVMKADNNLTREEKQQLFNHVVDGLFADGRITKKQQVSWTHPF